VGGWNEVTKSDTDLTIFLVIDREGVGGVAGISPLPTVRLRDPLVSGSYYDFGDNTFKTIGWLLQSAPLADVGGGHYSRSLNVSTFPLGSGATFIAEYKVDDGAAIKGVDSEMFLISALRPEATLLRKYHTNKMHEASGLPGTLQLYDDDDATVLRTHQLRDESGGAIAPTVLTPARRSKGV